MAQVSVISISNIPGCPQPFCDTVWGPKLVVNAGTPACSGVNHQNSKKMMISKNVSKHIMVTFFFSVCN